jgi:hypothetical protein
VLLRFSDPVAEAARVAQCSAASQAKARHSGAAAVKKVVAAQNAKDLLADSSAKEKIPTDSKTSPFAQREGMFLSSSFPVLPLPDWRCFELKGDIYK